MRLTWILFRNIFPSLIRKGFFQILWVTNLKTCLFSIVGRIYSIILSNENSASEKSNVFLRFWTEFFVGLKIWLHIDPLILSRKKGKPCAKEIHHHIIEILYSFFFFFFGDLISWKIWSIQVGYLSHSIGIVFGTLAYILKSLSSLLSLLLCMISSFVLFDFQSSCFSSQNEKFLPYNQRKVVKSSKPKTQRCEVTNSQWRI